MRALRILSTGLFFLSSCNQTKELDSRISSLDERVEKLEKDAMWRDLDHSSNGVAFLRTSETSYSMAGADFGNVAIAIENVGDYADGTKIILSFGNTTSATVTGLKAKIDWGQVDGQGAIKEGEKSKNVSFVEDLPPASWKKYEVILPGTPANKVGFVRLSEIQSTSISLMKSK